MQAGKVVKESGHALMFPLFLQSGTEATANPPVAVLNLLPFEQRNRSPIVVLSVDAGKIASAASCTPADSHFFICD